MQHVIKLTLYISNTRYLEQTPWSLGCLVLISFKIMSLCRFMTENSDVIEILIKHLFGLRFIKLKFFYNGMEETPEN